MKFTIKNNKGFNVSNLMRRLGYHFFRESYFRRLGSGYYPKFHIYIKENNDNLIFNLHLDQKKASYQGQTAHSGDYDGELLEEEKRRIFSLYNSL